MTPFWSNLFLPRLDWLQIEVTTHCNARCAYCPHTLYQSSWQSQHLPLALFQRLLPSLKKTRLVYLQGWGEPLLHPDFFTLVHLARQAGCQVGTTTNATVLTEAVIERLLDSGLDILALSLTGLGANHDRWRQGTHYEQVLEAVRAVAAAKRRRQQQTPRIHLAYLLLRSGLADLARLPEALQGLEISQVVISTLDFVAAPELRQEAGKLASPAERHSWQQALAAVARAGQRRGLTIHIPSLLTPPGPQACPENVLRAAVVSAAGQLSPCVFRTIPAAQVSYYGQDSIQPLEPCHFGSLAHQGLPALWHSPAYRAFRRAWQAGSPPPCCQGCLRIQ